MHTTINQQLLFILCLDEEKCCFELTYHLDTQLKAHVFVWIYIVLVFNLNIFKRKNVKRNIYVQSKTQ